MDRRVARLVVLAAVILAFGSAVAGPARATHADTDAPDEFRSQSECIQAVFARFDGNGRCISSDGVTWRPVSHADTGAGAAFGTFVLFALLWAAIPAVASGMIAANRGQSIGIAVLLAIVLGWLGLLIVVFALKPEVSRAAKNLIDSAAASPPAPREPARDPATRLSDLEELRKRGLISDVEYESRRRAILDGI